MAGSKTSEKEEKGQKRQLASLVIIAWYIYTYIVYFIMKVNIPFQAGKGGCQNIHTIYIFAHVIFGYCSSL